MYNINHTRTLYFNFDGEFCEHNSLQSEWISTAIDHLEVLSESLQTTLITKNPKFFLEACDDSREVIYTLKDEGLKRTVAKLKAHFRKDITLDDLSFRRNTLRLQAIGTMLIQALAGRATVA
jgi:hypothetical protein